MEQVKSNLSLDETSVIILGNKCDIEQREVSNEEGIELANSYEVKFYETSALKNIGIKEAFQNIAKIILKKKKYVNENEKSFSLKPENPNKSKKSCCS